MKKKIVLIFTLFSFCLGAQNTSQCDHNLISKLSSLMEEDKQGILSKQFELTTLKLAQVVVKKNKKTFEEIIKQKSSEIANLDKSTLDKLENYYNEYGLIQDQSNFTKYYEQIKSKSKNSNYYNKNFRIYNQSSSGLILLISEMEPSLGLNIRDAAITWLMSHTEINKKKQFGEYSAQHNLHNLSTKIARYSGAIKGLDQLSEKQFLNKISQLEDGIENEFTKFKNNFKKDFSFCFDGNNYLGGCELNQDSLFNSYFKSLKQVADKLAPVAVPDQIKIINNEVRKKLKLSRNHKATNEQQKQDQSKKHSIIENGVESATSKEGLVELHGRMIPKDWIITAPNGEKFQVIRDYRGDGNLTDIRDDVEYYDSETGEYKLLWKGKTIENLMQERKQEDIRYEWTMKVRKKIERIKNESYMDLDLVTRYYGEDKLLELVDDDKHEKAYNELKEFEENSKTHYGSLEGEFKIERYGDKDQFGFLEKTYIFKENPRVNGFLGFNWKGEFELSDADTFECKSRTYKCHKFHNEYQKCVEIESEDVFCDKCNAVRCGYNRCRVDSFEFFPSC